MSKSKDRLTIAEAYFQASQRRLGMLYHENSILAGQCTFLTGVYLCSTNQILAGWKSFVHASNQILAWLRSNDRLQQEEFQENITSDKHPESPASITKNYVEESLYWSCLKSEV